MVIKIQKEIMQKLKKKIIKGINRPSLIWLYFSTRMNVLLINISFYINHLPGKKNLIFEITSPGEFWYVEPIWNKLKKDKQLEIYFSVRLNNDIPGLCWSDFMSLLTQCNLSENRIIPSDLARRTKYMDLFLSPTAWTESIPHESIPRIQIFHTIGSKSMLSLENLFKFNVLFLTGPNQKKEFEQKFIKKYPGKTELIRTFEVGYPKSDALIKKSYNKEKIMTDLSINPGKVTVIYAPNWELPASLHKTGHEIIQTLAKMDINLLIKLHHMSLRSPKDFNATGGVDWRNELKKYQQTYSNVTPIFDLNSNPYLYVSDIMVTDAGGVGFEYLLLDKPVIFVDVPEYFERYGCDGIDYWGRCAGIIVKKTEDIPKAVQRALDKPMELSPQRKELISKIIYNPGCSADKAAQIILQLLSL